MIPRGGYLRLVHYHIRGNQGHHPWPENDWFHTTLPDSVETAFALLKSLEDPGDPLLAPPLVRLIARLAEREVRKELPHAGKGAMTFEKIRNFVEYHFSEPIGREDIAAYFHLHPSYVSQLFHQYARRSLQDSIAACRIARAKYLLSETDAPVKQIAEECGFGCEVYFIRRFREITGSSPDGTGSQTGDSRRIRSPKRRRNQNSEFRKVRKWKSGGTFPLFRVRREAAPCRWGVPESPPFPHRSKRQIGTAPDDSVFPDASFPLWEPYSQSALIR